MIGSRTTEGRIPLLFLGMLIVSVVGSLAVENHWLEVVFNHLGGLGVVGLLACLAAYTAGKKGLDRRRAFFLGLVFPVVLGVVAVLRGRRDSPCRRDGHHRVLLPQDEESSPSRVVARRSRLTIGFLG